MKKIVIGLLILLITSQIFAWVLGIVGLAFYTPDNVKTGIACYNISNALTLSRKQKAKNYFELGRTYTIKYEGPKGLLYHEKSAKYFGNCNKYNKNSLDYSACRGNTVFLGLEYYAKGDFEKSANTYISIGIYSDAVSPYILLQDYDNALRYAQKALNKEKTTGNYLQMAVVNRFLENNELANQYYNKMLRQARIENLSDKQINNRIYIYNNYKTYYIKHQAEMHAKQNF